jgi:hypothetical protein
MVRKPVYYVDQQGSLKSSLEKLAEILYCPMRLIESARLYNCEIVEVGMQQKGIGKSAYR